MARHLFLLLGSSLVWWSTLFILCLVLVAPLAAVDVPPLLDYPNHLARAYVLAHGQADPHLSQMYAPHWAIIPNLAIDLILPPLLLIIPVHIAGRILLAVALVMPVVGTVLYSQAVFARRSYWPLAGCLVASNGLFLLGFVNFQLGLGLALVCAAAWRRWRETRPLTNSLGRAAWSMPIILVPLALYGASAFTDKAPDITWETWPDKLIRAAMSVVNYNLPLDIFTACFLAMVLLTLATLRLIVVPLGSVIALAAIAVLFMVSPFSFKGTGYVDARFAVMFGFLLFGVILPVGLPRKSTFLIGFAMLALFGIRTVQTAAVWDAHSRDLDQFRSAISAVEPGSRVLLAAVSIEEADLAQHDFLRRQHLSDGSRLDAHTAALLLIERHAFWPFLFANHEQQPVELRSPYAEIAEHTAGIPDVRLLAASIPEPGDVARFPLVGQWSCCYDYVLLMEAGSHDFHHHNLELLYQSDYASLFRVKHPPFVPVSRSRDYPVTTDANQPSHTDPKL
jgi:hypothetical protein